MARRLLSGAAAFVAMEPVTYAAHRWVMHGAGWVLHRSHHRPPAAGQGPGRLEANDWFPVGFAGLTVAVMAAGTRRPSRRALVAVGAGISAYGAAYGFVHDIYTHGRLGRLARRRGLERLAEAHALHHRFGGEPYGMLLPVVPRCVAARAASATLRQVGTRARVENTS